jgi:hypothetical protein
MVGATAETTLVPRLASATATADAKVNVPETPPNAASDETLAASRLVPIRV